MADKYTKDVLMQGTARIVGGLLSFLAVFVLTYLFDESQIGEYNIILSTVNVITSVFTLWLSQGILRYYKDKKDFGFLLLFTLMSSVCCIIVFLSFNLFTRQMVSIHTYIYIFILVFYNIFDALYRKERRLLNYVLLELTLSFSRLFPMIVIAKYTKDINSVFISQYSLMFIYIMVCLVRNKNLKSISFQIEKALLIKYLKFGLPLLGLSISNWFLTSSDRYIIKYFESDFSVGVYSTNYSLANSIYMMFSLILVNAFHPIIVEAWDKDKKEATELVSKVIDYYLILVLPLVFYGCLKSSILLGLFNGNNYAQYSNIFVWTVLGIFVYGLSLLYHKYFELIQNTKRILIYNIFTAGINIVLNIILVPRLGFSVAAFTTFVSYISYLLMVRLSTFRVFKVKFSLKNAFKILLSILLFGLVDYWIVLQDNIVVFVTEGFIYVIYTILFYQIFKVYDIFGFVKKNLCK